MPHYTIPVRIDARELKRLEEYEQQKDMSKSAIMRQALRVYDMMEQTPGAYEAVQKITRDKLSHETSAALTKSSGHGED